MANIFISKSIQISSQWKLIMIIVSEIMVNKMIIEMMRFISTGTV